MAYKIYVNDNGGFQLVDVGSSVLSDEYPTRADIVAGCVTAPIGLEESDTDQLLTESGDVLLGERTLLPFIGAE